MRGSSDENLVAAPGGRMAIEPDVDGFIWPAGSATPEETAFRAPDRVVRAL